MEDVESKEARDFPTELESHQGGQRTLASLGELDAVSEKMRSIHIQSLITSPATIAHLDRARSALIRLYICRAFSAYKDLLQNYKHFYAYLAERRPPSPSP